MVLTEEQKERIKKNKERALEIRRKKEEEGAAHNNTTEANNYSQSSTTRGTSGARSAMKSKVEDDENEPVELEEFEIDASSFVTKQDAMKIYCLPAGTLEVCEYVEKDNPRNQKFSKMKLYHRNEIRRRARERFDGLDGLKEERSRRETKRFERDFEDVNDIFKTERKKKKSG